MTYNVFGGTLSLAQPLTLLTQRLQGESSGVSKVGVTRYGKLMVSPYFFPLKN